MAYVTVIIPCLNHAQFVGAAIESVLTQTYADCAVIVVDDGSTDDSLSVIQRHCEQAPNRVSLIKQPRHGFSKARDAGIAQATGEWVVILDAEDTLLPEAISAWMTYADAHPEHSVIYSGWNDVTFGGEIDKENLPNTWTDDPLEGNILATIVRSFDGIMQPSLIKRTAILAAGGYFHPPVSEAGNAGWIHLFGYFRMLLNGVSFGYVPRVLVNTREKFRRLALDKAVVGKQRLAVYAYAFEKDPKRMITTVDRVNEIRRAQLKDAFDVIDIRNNDVKALHGEIANARKYQETLERSLEEYRMITQRNGSSSEQQVQSLLLEIDRARNYQAWQDQTIGTLRQQVYDLEKSLEEARQRITRDSNRPQQISALIDHIETLEAELAVYRATTSTEAEERMRELHEKLQTAQQELEEIRASPAFRLLGRRSSRKEQKT